MANDYLAVSEIFGPTIQGEGKNIGMPTMFLRLGGCNQHCHWCDTPYTWRFSEQYPHDWGQVFDPKKEIHTMAIEDVADELMKYIHVGNLVVSGGEPMLQKAGLYRLFRNLRDRGWGHIEIETAGTIAPSFIEDVDLYTVSLKLPSSGNPASLSINPNAIVDFLSTDKAIWKFVATSIDDFEQIDELVQRFNLSPVYIMPEGIRASDIQRTAQEITKAAIDRGYFMTTRMQILLYGNRRGV